ncbi:hypothetical protein C6P46_005841 [Rhodotorula mucilaginosa]|uniref:SCP domain-containing protein n=1 Tax=Rhodotorula mucilaginosa TaxID=5537 RepID=A0A9P6VZT0_RHOMI|nr:hypothetical protein C6P46_005841 [Rhodotorula mucilaginosa]
MLSSSAGRTWRPRPEHAEWPSQAPERAFLSMGHRQQADDEGGSDGESTGSDSSADSYRKTKRRTRRPAPGADADSSSSKISPSVLVLAILFIAAIGAAVYFAMESRRIPDVGVSSNSSSPNTGTDLTVTETVVSVTTAPPAGPGASTDKGATPSLAESPKDGASSKANNGAPTDASDGTPTVTKTATGTKDKTGSAAPAPTKTGNGGGDSKDPFVQDCLSEHNTFRATHHADPLVWNTTIQAAAQKWADHCVWEHSGGKVGPYGENLYALAPITQTQPLDAKAGIKAWNDEEKMYDYSKPTGFTHETGHFTQTVWKGTKQLGCAFARCDDIIGKGLGAFLVCEYWPGGNMVGSENKYFRENVLPP